MIDHVSVGVSDMARSLAFYRAVLSTLDYRCLIDLPEKAGFGRRYPQFWILSRPSMRRAHLSCGLHLAFVANSEDAVRNFHAMALAFGGTCDGKPGQRAYTMTNAFAAFLFDPDGNRLEAVWFPERTQPPSR